MGEGDGWVSTIAGVGEEGIAGGKVAVGISVSVGSGLAVGDGDGSAVSAWSRIG